MRAINYLLESLFRDGGRERGRQRESSHVQVRVVNRLRQVAASTYRRYLYHPKRENQLPRGSTAGAVQRSKV